MMIKRRGVVLTLFFLFFLIVPVTGAQDLKQIEPDPAGNVSESSADMKRISQTLSLAQNTGISDDETLDDELMKEYDDEPSGTKDVPDPLYYFNYAMYGLNDFLYYAAIKPVATGYKAIMPTPVRKGIRNFFHNLLFPVRLVNNLLQGKVSEAGTEVEIFFINSTVGFLGIAQVAQDYYDKHTSDEDLGQTFGSYSAGEGFYLVLPVLGPSTLRDTIGLVGDYFLTPLNYVEPWELSLGLKVTDNVNAASYRLGDYEALKEAAVDPYTALKNAYIQSRNKKISK